MVIVKSDDPGIALNPGGNTLATITRIRGFDFRRGLCKEMGRQALWDGLKWGFAGRGSDSSRFRLFWPRVVVARVFMTGDFSYVPQNPTRLLRGGSGISKILQNAKTSEVVQ